MSLTKESKSAIVEEYGRDPKNTGSTEVQIALLTARIQDLTDHFKINAKDHNSRRGLLKMVGRRRKLLNYLMKTDIEKYREIIKQLNIRK